MKTFRTTDQTHQNLVMISSLDEISIWVERFIRYQIAQKGIARGNPFVLGTATGSSPTQVYMHMIKNADDYKGIPIKFVQLDEYCGLEPDHKNSYRGEILNDLVLPLGFKEEDFFIPPSSGTDEAITEFEKIPYIYNIDVQILGIGEDAHLAFIQPGPSDPNMLDDFLNEGTKKVDLLVRNRASNARFFDGNLALVPTHAVTRGPRSILSAGWNIVIVNNHFKAMAAHAALTCPLCREVPASILMYHPRTIWLVANEASHIFNEMNQRDWNVYRNLLDESQTDLILRD